MKANEFVKKFGLKITKKILSNAPDWAYETAGVKDYANKEWSEKYPMGEYAKVDDLKRLIGSHDYIESLDGYQFMKDNLPYGYFGDGEYKDLIQKCLEDLESCKLPV